MGGEPLEEPRPDPAAVHFVGDGERNLRAGRIVEAHIGRECDRA